MKYKTTILTAACLTALAFVSPLHAKSPTPKASPAASAKMSPAASSEMAPKKMRAIPFRGMISEVDASAKTFTIAGKTKSRTFKMTDKTVITKGGEAATMKDVAANMQARGSYYKMEDGSMEVKSLKLGPLTEEEQAKKDARKAKRKAKKEAADGADASPSPEE